MPYSLKQAAAACGRSKSAVYSALKSGKLKHTLDEKGRFQIEPDDLETFVQEQPRNVQPEHEQTALNDEKNGLFRQKIEFLEQTITALTDDRNQWREQAKAAAQTIENQAAALATATAASARAITQADEMRRQLLAIEASKSEAQEQTPTTPPKPEPPAEQQPRNPPFLSWSADPVYLWSFAIAAAAAAMTAPYWLPVLVAKN